MQKFQFTQVDNQMEAAPLNDVEEYLVFYVQDSYDGHYNKVQLPVTVKKPVATGAKKE